MSVRIPLTKGKTAIVDKEDAVLLLKMGKWFAHWNGQKWYVVRNKQRPTRGLLRIHRVIVNADAGVDVDHINGDTFDNRRKNLRICTRSQNLCNKSLSKNNTSGFRGVYWHKQCRKWMASISHKGRQKALGLFVSKEKAAEAYDKAARQLHGEFARLNLTP